MKHLLPCPFCGGKQSTSTHGSELAVYDMAHIRTGVYFVHCYKCEANGPHADDKEAAAKVWNRRHKRR